MESIYLAVNGTLMRGFPLNQNLLDVNAKFISERKTSKEYRLWTIEDQYPAMFRDKEKGSQIDVEIWELSIEGLFSVLKKEPAGLCIGKLKLENDDYVYGVLAEPYITNDQREITEFGGWRNYINAKTNP